MSGNYIVVFKKDVSQDTIDKHANEINQNGGEVQSRFGVIKGFKAVIPDTYLTQLQSLQGGSEIDYIEPDGTVSTQ
ncbi:hypothetical protein BV25DRAFT_1912901 [Artomyces pyxidatus]|uniref:Uncharacterized protein n=1 Tax=Artomyces pyxidatus TaxID=48021 RepID=A0ACB8TD30_9AGAM|nr:hypothetical protein BV25DRAFT_1912901 [Artomyces pyxidatus]